MNKAAYALALAVAASVHAQVIGPTARACEMGRCTAPQAPVGACNQNSQIYTNTATAPPTQYSCVASVWTALGGGSGTTLPSNAPLIGTNSAGIAFTVSTIPSTQVTGLAPSATTDTTNAANISGLASALPSTVVPFGLVTAGDSRFAGQNSQIQTWQTFDQQLKSQPNFTGHTAYTHNGAVAGATCASMTSSYSANVYPYRPSAQSVATAYLYIEVGVNDVAASTSLTSYSACLKSYVNTALGDGFTPIVSTIYYDGSRGSTNFAAEQLRGQYNDFIRTLQYTAGTTRIGLFDIDQRLPAEQTDFGADPSLSVWYGSPTVTASMTAFSVSSGVATFTVSNSFTAAEALYISGFPAAYSCMEGQNVVVSATGLSSTSFQAPVACPNVSSTATTATAQYIQRDALHLSPSGIRYVMAPAANQDFGLFVAGSAVGTATRQNIFTVPGFYGYINALLNVNGTYPNLPALTVTGYPGGIGQISLIGSGSAYFQTYNGTTYWQYGSYGGNSFLVRNGGTGTQPLSIDPATPTGALTATASALTTTLPFTTPNLMITNSCDASTQAGSDTGAKMTACDTALGTTTGNIVISSPLAGTTVSTSPTISANHTLQILVPLTWGSASHPTMASGSKILGNDALAPQTIQSTGNWVSTASVGNLEIAHLKAAWSTLLGGDNGNRLFFGAGVNNVFAHDNQTSQGGVILTTSTADNPLSNSAYGSVTTANSSSYIYAYNNYEDGVVGPCYTTGGATATPVLNCPGNSVNVYGDYFRYTNHIFLHDETMLNMNHAVFVLGGFNGTDCTTPTCVRKASDIHVSNLTITNVQGGVVTSVADGLVASGLTVTTCDDVCLDAEGSSNNVFSHFIVSGATNGELSIFPNGNKISFDHGKLVHNVILGTYGGESLSIFTTGTNDPTKQLDYSFDVITADCALTTICTVQFDPATQTTLSNSHLINTQVRNGDGSLEQGNVTNINNTYDVSIASTLGFTGTTTSGNATVTLNTAFGARQGQMITGTGIPTNTFINSVNVGANQVTMSANATASASGVAVAISAPIIDVSTYGSGQEIVRGNAIRTSAGQRTQQAAILGQMNYNNSGLASPSIIIDGNTTGNSAWPVDLLINIASNSSGSTPVIKSQNNTFGSNSVQTSGTANYNIGEVLYTPATSSAYCVTGQTAKDASYSYVCTAASTWKRAALNAF